MIKKRILYLCMAIFLLSGTLLQGVVSVYGENTAQTDNSITKVEEDETVEDKDSIENGVVSNDVDLKSRAAFIGGDPVVEISNPLKVNRSEILDKKFLPSNAWNLNNAWGMSNAYSTWLDNGIVSMLSLVNINNNNIAPKPDDTFAYDKLYSAMGQGTVSFIQNMNRVAVLTQKIRKVPTNIPLSQYKQLKNENTYEEPYIFKTTYSLDYNSHKPLFENNFIVTDDYRQMTFKFVKSDDNETHGEFTSPIETITLSSYQDTKVPNNVLGIISGKNMKKMKLEIPEYKLDEGWNIGSFRVGDKNYTLDQIKNLDINENTEVEIILKKPIIEVNVPAVWIPVDKESNEVIESLNPKPTYPDMYERPEVAKANEAGIYEIDYMGVPKPLEPGSWSGNNFMYTSNLFFTDRFHRIVAQAYGTWELDEGNWQPGSSVRKLEYGDYKDIAPFDSNVNKWKGLHGIQKTSYQEGETLKLYIATKMGQNLSEPEFKVDKVYTNSQETDLEIREKLVENILRIDYFDIDALKPSTMDNSDINNLFIYQYDSDDNTKGNFLKENGEYRNFFKGGLSTLPEGKYEVVIPIYWEHNIPIKLSSPDVFSRNRYKVDDTIHFTMVHRETLSIDVNKQWIGKQGTEVVVNLLANGEKVDSKTLTEADKWKGTFKNLLKYNEKTKEEIKYTIEEKHIDGYSTEITGTPVEGFTIVNKEEMECKPSYDNKPKVEIKSFKSPETGDRENMMKYIYLVLGMGIVMFAIRFIKKYS